MGVDHNTPLFVQLVLTGYIHYDRSIKAALGNHSGMALFQKG
jgi:hypothetical protein